MDAARAAVLACAAAPPAPAVVYIAKMFAVPASSLPRGAVHGASPSPDPTEEVFLAFGRVFSGTLRDGDRVHVLSAAYDPAVPARHRLEAQVCCTTRSALRSCQGLDCHLCLACIIKRAGQ